MAKEKDKKGEGRRIVPWRPFSSFSGLSRMEREMERMFEDFRLRPWSGFGWPRWWEQRFREPVVEVYEEKDDVMVKAELPGMKKEDIQINISENLLTLRGEKKEEREEKKEGYHYSERSYGSFERTIEIPREVQADKAKANFKEGVLEIRIPKTEEAKRKEIKIQVD